MWEPFVGQRSTTQTNRVEPEAIRKYAEAIGDPNPIYLDKEAASNSPYGRLIAPPTFPVTFGYGKIEGLKLPGKGLIHGSETLDYERPLFVGEDVSCYTVFKNFNERTGKNGTLSFLVFERVGEDSEGNRIFTANETFIVTEAVRKSLEEGGSDADSVFRGWPRA